MAFLVGVCTAIPVLVLGELGVETFVTRVLAISVCLLYLVSLFYFVFGPQRWETYRFVPVDGGAKVFGRCVAWMLGGLLSAAILEGSHVI